MRKNNYEIKAEKLAKRLLSLPDYLLLSILQGVLYEKKGTKWFYSQIKYVVEVISSGHITTEEKYKNPFIRAEMWAEGRLRNEKDPDKLRQLTPRRLVSEYAHYTSWPKALLHKVMVKVKRRMCMRQLRQNRMEVSKE